MKYLEACTFFIWLTIALFVGIFVGLFLDGRVEICQWDEDDT